MSETSEHNQPLQVSGLVACAIIVLASAIYFVKTVPWRTKVSIPVLLCHAVTAGLDVVVFVFREFDLEGSLPLKYVRSALLCIASISYGYFTFTRLDVVDFKYATAIKVVTIIIYFCTEPVAVVMWDNVVLARNLNLSWALFLFALEVFVTVVLLRTLYVLSHLRLKSAKGSSAATTANRETNFIWTCMPLVTTILITLVSVLLFLLVPVGTICIIVPYTMQPLYLVQSIIVVRRVVDMQKNPVKTPEVKA